MRILRFLLEKEFRQIFRNKLMLPIIFVLPIVQSVVLVYTASFDLKEINLLIVDEDMSTESRKLSRKFIASPFYVADITVSNNDAIETLISGEKQAVLRIPAGFEKNRNAGENVNLQLIIDAVNQQSAGLINAYTKNIVRDYSADIMIDQGIIKNSEELKLINVQKRFWYNPGLNYKHYMLPGILVILVTIIGTFLTALNIVREREIGTMEQINVTPVKKWQFMVAKLLPFMIIALFVLSLGLLIGVLLFSLPIVGSLITLFVFSVVYLFTAIALGLLVANEAKTQQQVMFTVFFFFVLFVLMSGIFTPVESMPEWAKLVNKLNPMYYFIKAIRMIILKGSVLADVMRDMISLFVLGIVLFCIAVFRYRKTT